MLQYWVYWLILILIHSHSIWHGHFFNIAKLYPFFLHSFFKSIKLIGILKLGYLKNKHILSIFPASEFFNRFHFFPNQKYRILSHKQILTNIRITLVTRFRILKTRYQCSCQTQLNVQIWTFKRDHCSVHIKRNTRPWNEFWN